MNPTPPAPLVAPDLSAAIDTAVGAAIADLGSPESRRSYEVAWRFYRAWLTSQQLEVTAVKPRHITAYIAQMKVARTGKPQVKGSRGRALTVIRSMYSALVRDEIMETNPALCVKGPKVDGTPKAPYIADEADLEKLLNVPASSWTERRDRLIVRMTFGLGWRRAEVARVKLEDIDGETISATVKGGKRITVGLPDWLAEDIFEWRQFAGIDAGPLFPRRQDDPRMINGAIVYRVVRQSCAKAEIEVVPPHALRRTNVTLGGIRGVPLKERQLAVGHSSSSTTERYDRARNAAATKVGNAFASLVHA